MSGYGPRPIKRGRRTKAAMDVIRWGLEDIVAEEYPMSVRQVYYAATVRGLIDKTEAEYKTVVRLLGEMRRDGTIPYQYLADATRWMRKPATFSSAAAALHHTAKTYRRALWDDSDTVVEVWLEKEALAGVVVGVTDEWDVPLMVCRGYPSMSFLYSAADAITDRAWKEDDRQRTVIYYFGDYDPSGVDIDRAVCHGIGEAIWSMLDKDKREPTPRQEFSYCADFQRVAVTIEQINEWHLPTRPTKVTDTRSRKFVGESVELDAIPADALRALVTEVIERHVDQHQLSVLRTFEEEERKVFVEIAETFIGGPDRSVRD